MYLRVAVGASVHEKLVHPGSRTCYMPAMALQAEEWHGRLKQRGIHRTVRGMAVRTVFRDIAVLKGKRPLFLHVAPGTGFLRGCTFELFILEGTMDLMAVGARHLFLYEGVVGKETVLHLHIGMTPVTEFSHFIPTDLLLGAAMQLVAVETADVVHGMGAGVPERQDRCGCSRVTLETEHGLGLGGEINDIEEGGGFTFPVQFLVYLGIFVQLLYCQAAWPMARFAVNQRKAGFGLDLFPMNAVLEVVGYLVVLVAPGNTVVGADILRIEPPHYQSLVLANRKQRTTLLDLRTRC
jgi:hypothetical protein